MARGHFVFGIDAQFLQLHETPFEVRLSLLGIQEFQIPEQVRVLFDRHALSAMYPE